MNPQVYESAHGAGDGRNPEHAIAKQLDAPLTVRYHEWSWHRRHAIYRMRLSGMTYAAIGRAVGLSGSMIQVLVRRAERDIRLGRKSPLLAWIEDLEGEPLPGAKRFTDKAILAKRREAERWRERKMREHYRLQREQDEARMAELGRRRYEEAEEKAREAGIDAMGVYLKLGKPSGLFWF